MKCPCGTDTPYEICCGPYLAGTVRPDTAEKLMRSRYTAHARGDIPYIQKTLTPEGQAEFDAAATKKWCEESTWKGLEILECTKGGATDTKGIVEFVATYERNGTGIEHHEVSHFRKGKSGQWLFVDGEAHEHKEGEGHHHHAPSVTVKRESAKIGRNDPCPCGSGKKYKKCCEKA